MIEKLRDRTRVGPRDTLHDLLEKIHDVEDFAGLKTISQVVMDALMQREREVFLRRNGEDNKANGFYPRRLSSGLGSIDLAVPRDRLGQFRPFLLPESWQRGDQSVDDLMASLLFHAFSPNKIRAIFKDLGLPYSTDYLDELQKVLEERSRDFKSREFDESSLALISDAYHTGIKDPDTHKLKKAVIHTVLGIGGYFHSDRTLPMAVQALVDKLHRHRWKKPLPAFVECEYEIYQMFRQRFP